MSGPLADSGNRTEFQTGALRDMAPGKGRYDLLPACALRQVQNYYNSYNRKPLMYLDDCIECMFKLLEGDRETDYAARVALQLMLVIEEQECAPEQREHTTFYRCISHALHRLAVHYENGAKKYTDRNWEKGLPLWNFLDSGIRHLFKLIQNQKYEDHAAAALWNIVGFIWTRSMIYNGKLPETLADGLPEGIL